MYGFIALLDEKTECLIKDIWKELKELSISSYAFEVEDRVPHITIASYQDLNIEKFISDFETYFDEKKMIDFSFNTIGSFLNSGTLFFSPVVTNELFDFHMDFHRNFVDFNSDEDSLYLPGKWIPHCTIANRLSREKLKEAFDYCSQRSDSIKGRLSEVALIDVSEPNKAPILFKKKLKDQ